MPHSIPRNRSSWALVLLLGIAACRDTQPPQSLYRDLGDETRPLPPPASTARMNPALKDGRAEWHPFREPTPEAPAADDKALAGEAPDSPVPDDADGEKAAPDTPEAAIRAMVNEYNALAAEGKTEDLLDFYVESQIDAAKALIDEQATLVAPLAEVRQALESKLPDDKERIAAALETLQAVVAPRIDLRSVSVTSPQEAMGTTPAFTDFTYRFVTVDEDWYIELPPEKLSGLHAALKSLAPLLTRWKSELDAGQPDAPTVLADIEKAGAPAPTPADNKDEAPRRAPVSGG